MFLGETILLYTANWVDGGQTVSISPIAQGGVYHRMVDRIETSVGPIPGIKEWKDMHTAK